MNKGIKKRNSYNPVILDHLVEKYGFSKVYIRQSIDGTKKGTGAITGQKEIDIYQVFTGVTST